MTRSGFGRSRGAGSRIRTIAVILFGLVLIAGVASAASLDSYADEFAASSFSGTDGSLAWATDWIEVGESDGANTGLIEVNVEPHCADTICLVLGKSGAISDAGVEREADLSGTTSASLSFQYKRHIHLPGSGRVDLEVSPNGGTDWYPLDSWNLDTDDAGQVGAWYDLTPYRSVNTRIRFSVVGSADASHLNVDHLAIHLVDGDQVLYLVSDGGSGDQLTAVDPADLDPATNEVDIGTGTGTTSIRAAAMQPGTNVLFAADGGQLGTVDRAAGVFTPLPSSVGVGNGPQGLVSFDDIRALAFDPFTGVLYGVHQRPLFVEDLLLVIDPVTGSASPGWFGGDDYLVIQEQATLYHVSDIAVDPTDGQMYGVHWSLLSATHQLITIDSGSGATAVLGIVPDATKGLAFDEWGQLWGSTAGGGGDTLFQLDKTDGTATQSRILDNGADYESLAAALPSFVNLPPVFDQDLPDRGDAETWVVSIAASATDPDLGDALTYSAVGLPPGLSIDPGSGLISGTISAGAAGTYATQITVVDDGVPALNDVDTFTWTIGVTPTLDPIGSRSVDEGVPLAFTATATDPDLPGDTLTFTLEGSPPAGASITAGGVFAWTPTETQGPGVYPVTVRVTDSIGAFDEETITVTVGEVNQSPVLDPVGSQTVDEGSLLSLTATASDLDLPADSLTFSLEGSVPAGASITAGGVFSWTPSEAQGPGVYAITIRVTDDGAPALFDEEPITVTVVEQDMAPVITDPGPQTNGEGDAVSLFAPATDGDLPADVLTWSAVGLPPGLGIDPLTGEISGTIDPTAAAASPYTVTVTVTDDDGLWDDTAFTWTVVDTNRSPVLDPVGSQAVAEGSVLTVSVTATDPDLPPNSLTFSLEGSVPAGASITAGGVFSWTPSEAQGPGAYGITIRVTDDGVPALFDEETITVTVSESHSSPVLTPIGDRSVDEKAALTFVATAIDADLPANALTFTLVGSPPAGASITAGGMFTWTPTEAQGPGVFAITIRVTDDTGRWDEETLQVTVIEVNLPPALGPIGDQVIGEGDLLSLALAATDPDATPNSLTFTLAGSPPAGASITVGGAFAWVPSEAQGPGVYTITVRVTDDGVPALFDEKTFVVTVVESNRAPVIGPIAPMVVGVSETLTFTVVVTDPDLPAGPVTLSIQGPPPAGSALTPSGVFTWTPGESQVGLHLITISATDPGGLWDEATVLVTVQPPNSPPTVLHPGDRTVTAGDALTISVTASDPDGTTPSLTGVAGLPPWAVFVDNGDGTASVVGNPTLDDVGQSLITVRASDGVLTDEVSFVVRVEPPAIALLPVPDLEVTEHSTLTYAMVLTGEATGAEFGLSGDIPEGVMIDPVRGVLTWTPTEAQGPGTYEFWVELRDSLTADVLHQMPLRILVAEEAMAPTVKPVPGLTADRGAQFIHTIDVVDGDLPASRHEFTLVGEVPPGMQIDRETGVVTWSVPSDFDAGTHIVTVHVADRSDRTLSTEVQLSILVRAPDVAERRAVFVAALAADPVEMIGELPPPTQPVRRVVTLMSTVGLATVQLTARPLIYLLLLGALVVSIGRISLVPILGRSRRMQGVVVWRDESGYGFVLPDDESLEVFYHDRMVKRGHQPPSLGSRVSFRMVRGGHRTFAFGIQEVGQA